MREIKFRAWDKDQGMMIYDNESQWKPINRGRTYPVTIYQKGIIFCEVGRWGKENEVKDENGNVGYLNWEYDEYYQNCEIMQYTGLKDRNGKEVYEGDLIKHNGYIYEIVYNGGGFTVKNTDSKTAVPASNDFLANININVIGNIYENPELLEKKELLSTLKPKEEVK